MTDLLKFSQQLGLIYYTVDFHVLALFIIVPCSEFLYSLKLVLIDNVFLILFLQFLSFLLIYQSFHFLVLRVYLAICLSLRSVELVLRGKNFKIQTNYCLAIFFNYQHSFSNYQSQRYQLKVLIFNVSIFSNLFKDALKVI